MEYGMLRQNGTVGQNGTGQNGTIPSYPQRCFILHLKMPWFVLPHARSAYEIFIVESD